MNILKPGPTLVALLMLAAVLPALPGAAALGASCSDPIPLPANGSRTQPASTQEDWYFLHYAAGPVSYVVAMGATQNLYLQVYTEGCGTTLCFSDQGGSGNWESCNVPTGQYFVVRVYSLGTGIEHTLTYSGSTLPQCNDRVDNDGDGWKDHPADPGCSSPDDASESPNPSCSNGLDDDGDGKTDYPEDAACDSIHDDTESVSCPDAQPPVEFCVETGRVIISEVVRSDAPGPSETVVAYLDTYLFTAGGHSFRLPCVTLALGAQETSPCAVAGGSFVSRDATLVQQTVSQPEPLSGGEILRVSLCEAEATVLIMGYGAERLLIVAPC